ncbi:MAG TPA: 30S ribosome-binding factor RbfA [Polyangiaceae bacterium]|jgi:ribosome-binding factor A|nr:30S ribosome-binding factor RbfA [Polyangiaceae bacterium]
MTTDGRRGKRVAELLRAHLAELLRREVDDPRLAAVVLTSVEVTDDLMSARIGVRLLVGDEDPKVRSAVMKGLSKGAGRLRRLIAPRLELRRSPELRFHYDAGHDASRRVEELLHEIHEEARASATSTEPEEKGE